MNNSWAFHPHENHPRVTHSVTPSFGQPSRYYPPFPEAPQQQQPQPSSSAAWQNLQPRTNLTSTTAGAYGYEPGRWSTPPRPASAHPYPHYPIAQTTHSAGSASTPSSASWGAPTPASSWGPLSPPTINQPNSSFVHLNQAGYPMAVTAGHDSNFISNGYATNASISPGPGGDGANNPAWTTLAGWGTGSEPKKTKKKKRKDYPPAHMAFQTSSMPTPANATHPYYQQSLYPPQAYPTPQPPSQAANAYPPSHAVSALGPSASPTPSYAQPDMYTAGNLAKRPLDWRADYEPKSRAAYLLRVTKNRSEVKEYSDSVRRILHPLLLHTNPPPVDLDLRDNPLEPGSLEFPNLQRPHNDLDFAQLATTPAASILRLYHPRLPWYIDIHQTHCNGVTVFDILTQMFAQLMAQIQGRHYWNDVLSDEDRSRIVEAYSARCEGDSEEIGRGVLQIDFLGSKVVFEGLVRGRNGMWEIKTRKEEYSV
ncbi:hypothetical protein BDN72DRAFT_845801 [Pluteus cervinus]|uniref:Uncharacterized protein n=1 Tax=Pluteus cervinus TaxID=181527 RepID=A0ACD3AK19_9AGAR|nr:hypothetical protein BDN72DRAFT_845801 [Pluteus cervinus]